MTKTQASREVAAHLLPLPPSPGPALEHEAAKPVVQSGCSSSCHCIFVPANQGGRKERGRCVPFKEYSRKHI